MQRNPHEQRLVQTLERALGSPFYRNHLAGLTPAQWVVQWEQLPFTQKSDLMVHAPYGFLAIPLEQAYHYHESFGTTAKPMSSWFTAHDIDFLPAIAGHWQNFFGPGKKILNRFPYSFAVPAALVESIARQKGGVVIPASNLNWNVTYARTLELLMKMRPEILCALPLEPLILWELARYLKIPPAELQVLEHIGLSGGVLTPHMRRAIESRWGTKVWNIYGSTEASGMASTHASEDALWPHDEHMFFEVVDIDPPHAVSGAKEGILVVTTLTREAMPLVRYMTRDVVRVQDDGSFILVGRVDDCVDFGGKRLHKYDLEEAILEFAETYNAWVYFVVVSKDKLWIRLEVDGKRVMDQKALAVLRERLGVPLEVDLVARDTLLNRGWIAKTPRVFKPHTLSDWRGEDRRVATLGAALIEWPKYSAREITQMIWNNIRARMSHARFRN